MTHREALETALEAMRYRQASMIQFFKVSGTRVDARDTITYQTIDEAIQIIKADIELAGTNCPDPLSDPLLEHG